MAMTVHREPGDTARKILELNLAIMQHEVKLRALRKVRRKHMARLRRFDRMSRKDGCK